MNNKTANWRVELNTECPDCEEDVDLLDDADFWDGRYDLDLCEHDTDRSHDIEVQCPECGYAFKVDLTY